LFQPAVFERAFNPRPASCAAGLYHQTVALLLLWWLLVGWLAPTLLLLWPQLARKEASRRTEAQAAGGREAAAGLEAGLHSLLCEDPHADGVHLPPPEAATGRPPGHVPLLARWFLLTVGAWAACCAAAPLYGQA